MLCWPGESPIFKHIIALPVVFGLMLPTAAGSQASSCQFVMGFKQLHDAIPSIVGDCLENEVDYSPVHSEQHTTGGLLVWDGTSGGPRFTDGYQTWIYRGGPVFERLNSERFAWELTPPVTNVPASTTFSVVRDYTERNADGSVSHVIEYSDGRYDRTLVQAAPAAPQPALAPTSVAAASVATSAAIGTQTASAVYSYCSSWAEDQSMLAAKAGAYSAGLLSALQSQCVQTESAGLGPPPPLPFIPPSQAISAQPAYPLVPPQPPAVPLPPAAPGYPAYNCRPSIAPAVGSVQWQRGENPNPGGGYYCSAT